MGSGDRSFVDRVRGDNRGAITIAALVALLIGASPILLGTGRAPSVLDTLRSSAWFGTASGDLVQVNGLNGQQTFVLEGVTSGNAQVQVREDGSIIYILDGDDVLVVDGATRRPVPVDGAPEGGDQLLTNDRAVYVLDHDTGTVGFVDPREVRRDRTSRFLARAIAEPPTGVAGLDTNGALWSAGDDGVVHRIVRARSRGTRRVPAGDGRIDVVVAGTRVVAVHVDDGSAYDVTEVDLGPRLDLGPGVIVPPETLPAGPLVVTTEDGRLVTADPGDPGSVRSVEVAGTGPTSAPVVAGRRVVVVRGSTLLLYSLDLDLVAEEDLGDLSADRVRIRTRDGIAYVDDPDTGQGAVVNGDDIFPIDLEPEGDVPSGAVAPPDAAPPELTPPSNREPSAGPGEQPQGERPEGRRPMPGGEGGTTVPTGPGTTTPRVEPPVVECDYGVSRVVATPIAVAGGLSSATVGWRQATVPTTCTAEGATVAVTATSASSTVPGGTFAYTAIGANGSDEVVGLTDGEWVVDVTVTVAGQVAASARSAPFVIEDTGPTVPPAPSSVSVGSGPGSLTVTWPDAPGATSYRLVVGDAYNAVAASGTTVSGLDPVLHTVYVFSINEAGESASPVVGEGTPQNEPLQVTGFSISSYAENTAIGVTVTTNRPAPPSQCTYEAVPRRAVAETGGTTKTQSCTTLAVAWASTVYDVTLVAVDGTSIPPMSDTVETNRTTIYSGSGGDVTYTLNGSPGTVSISPGTNHTVECYVGSLGQLQSSHGGGGANQIPNGAVFDRTNPPFNGGEGGAYLSRIPPCGT